MTRRKPPLREGLGGRRCRVAGRLGRRWGRVGPWPRRPLAGLPRPRWRQRQRAGVGRAAALRRGQGLRWVASTPVSALPPGRTRGAGSLLPRLRWRGERHPRLHWQRGGESGTRWGTRRRRPRWLRWWRGLRAVMSDRDRERPTGARRTLENVLLGLLLAPNHLPRQSIQQIQLIVSVSQSRRARTA